MPEITPLSLSPKDAAATLGISVSRLYELLGEKRLKARKDGARTLVLVSSMVAYLDELPEADIKTGVAKRAVA